MPTSNADNITPSMAKTDMERRFAFNKELSVCKAPAKSKKLSMMSKSTLLKSIFVIKSLAKVDMVGEIIPATINNREKKIAIIITPIVSGSFRNLALK